MTGTAALRHTDLRVTLWLLLLSAVAVVSCTGELWFACMMAIGAVWLLLRRHLMQGLKFVLAYAALSGLARLMLGVRGLETLWLLINIGRRMLIPISFAGGISDTPTGTLLAVLVKLHLPKALGISTVVLLRYIPTISYELRSIRSSLKFRGTGLGFWNTLAHLPSNFERTLVPMLIRTTRIAEELSAAAMVRGVRLTGAIESYDEVRFSKTDAVTAALFSAAIVAVWILDKTAPAGTVV
jgi:energy-coupling factor transport system permease protein